MRKALTAIPALLLLLCSAAPGADEVEIRSDVLSSRGAVLELEGSVLVIRGDASIRAERAVYNTDTGEIQAEGNIRFDDPAAEITAERAEVNLRTERGVLHGASVLFKKDNYHFSGDEIRKIGEGRYRISQGSATTCEGLPPAWCFRGGDIDVVLGERVKAKHVTFRIKGVPVLYTPYLWAPILTERRTGLLFPTFGYRDSTGFFYRQPFFWAMAENRDATFFLDYYSKRAFGQGLEYRYVEGPGIQGNINLYHLRDSERKRDFFETRATHRQTGGRVTGLLDISHINHREFYRIYEPYIEQSSKRFLESRAEVAAPLGNSRLYVLGRYYQDLKDGVDHDTVLQRIPELGMFIAPGNLGPVILKGAAAATRFHRDDGLRGERYMLSVDGTYSVGRGAVITQTARARQFFYKTKDDTAGPVVEDSLDAGVYEYEATLLGAVERNFGRMRHIVESFTAYRYLTREGDAPPLFDSEDREEEFSIVEAALFNRLVDGKGEFLTLRVVQAYDFLKDEDELLPLRADITLRRPVLLSVGGTYDHAADEFASVSARADLKAKRTEVKASWFYTRDIDVNVYAAHVRQGFGPRFSLSAGLRYDEEEEGGVEEFTAGLGYQSQCWGVGLSLVDRRDDFSVFVDISLLGLGNFGAR